jgi:hypothetical protein
MKYNSKTFNVSFYSTVITLYGFNGIIFIAEIMLLTEISWSEQQVGWNKKF